jgi:DNA-binding CsgD family transcriptional regulator
LRGNGVHGCTFHGLSRPSGQVATSIRHPAGPEIDNAPRNLLDLGRAGEKYLGAEHLWRELPRPYEAARARTRAGRCILPADGDRGHRLLLDALTAFADLGAAWDAEGARQVLRRHGLVPPHRRGRRSYGNELSPREAEVVSLAAEGLHNREIARTLYLSAKTVEGHLSSATKKLGVTSRSELPDQLPGTPPARPRAG